MVRVKICGVTSESDLRAVERAGADAVGFIADVPVDTPRELSLDRAAELAAAAAPFLTTTLVTMPETVSEAIEVGSRVKPDVVQIHGEFDAEQFRAIRAGVDARIAAVVDAEQPQRACDLDSAVDAIVVDSVSDKGAGGTGKTHDWEQTAKATAELDAPVVLAGGLTPENVTEAVETVNPFAVDVASGVESSGGVKDHDAVRAFVANAAERRRATA
ncbi:phosphoribosylanthranilate isomerase [Halogeometricum borinquense DSM 11551]|uniref:N-(5'-phosphoribosyl)anthranilate isomerase n=2 Tax=Halogeometricum borinquense TaxID=60847 RepID=E4NQA7_HALBP|nr:phosphoribosylanthranilate isomerase [Halogeometricum borinquense]ADQ66669.1 phosphoribosylanthranilate isomerase [Halogeometricum borinquense DSM 11551]ELY30178.1 phosphoribosylanthranilate isomerase [Halogeometricum borinquense DSM 11551]RYJ14516.1 phosphoribosylanthranilate isomerase [Halogeometricum borinquense]